MPAAVQEGGRHAAQIAHGDDSSPATPGCAEYVFRGPP
jgi:hypothetical protein